MQGPPKPVQETKASSSALRDQIAALQAQLAEADACEPQHASGHQDDDNEGEHVLAAQSPSPSKSPRPHCGSMGAHVTAGSQRKSGQKVNKTCLKLRSAVLTSTSPSQGRPRQAFRPRRKTRSHRRRTDWHHSLLSVCFSISFTYRRLTSDMLLSEQVLPVSSLRSNRAVIS